MTVQTVLTYFDGSDHGKEQLRAAIDTALWFDAELTVAAVVYLPASSPGSFGPNDPDPCHRSAKAAAGVLSMRVFKCLAEAGVRGDAFPFVSPRAAFAREFAGLARYVDIVVELKTNSDLPAQLSAPSGHEISDRPVGPKSRVSGSAGNSVARVGAG